jgi:hypothetical protein
LTGKASNASARRKFARQREDGTLPKRHAGCPRNFQSTTTAATTTDEVPAMPPRRHLKTHGRNRAREPRAGGAWQVVQFALFFKLSSF